VASQLISGAIVTVVGLWLIRRFGDTLRRDADRAGILNRFTEYVSFAGDDQAIARSNLEALRLLVSPDAGVTHVLNRSKDRAIPEATIGDGPAEILPLGALSQCSGVIRGSTYVTTDASLPLSVVCPVYPVDHGTLACVPLSSGELVGAVHLRWDVPDALPVERRGSVARIAEHAALAIGNRRLMAALRGQASTDPRTGLANSRAFDDAFESALDGTAIDGRPIGLLMLDLDRFKEFNDRHGHPAGDEALRAFAGVLRSCVREQDLAARYGGEEFAVLLPGLEEEAVTAVAERIRARTESTIISLGPGITARLTVSVGIAMAPRQGTQRITLMRLADEALYQAKTAGRNRVSYLGVVPVSPLPGPSDVAQPARARRSSRLARKAG
jgi:diguanylate cyclase (GGDEF)-like protein